MINFNDVTEENIKAHNQNWLLILDQPYRWNIPIRKRSTPSKILIFN